MACYYPLDAWFTKERTLSFNRSDHAKDAPHLRLPCGRCIGCRLDNAKEWAVRACHEGSCHQENCFITLTYAPEYLPEDQSLNKRDYQLFLKHLRQKIHREQKGLKIRYMLCGEYGEDPDKIQNPYTGKIQLGRPHFHLIIFGWRPKDLVYFNTQEAAGDTYDTYTSKTVSDAWGKGFCTIGEFGFRQARYVAAYTVKKINGEQAENHYVKINPQTGELFNVRPEFGSQSNRPGIGKPWFDKFNTDCEKGYIHQDGYRVKVPEYYLRLMEETNPVRASELRHERALNQDPWHRDNDADRLRVREKVKQIRAKSAEARQ